jgi:hypothetical protein
LLLVAGNKRKVVLYIRNSLPQEAKVVAADRVKGTVRQPFFEANGLPAGGFFERLIQSCFNL